MFNVCWKALCNELFWDTAERKGCECFPLTIFIHFAVFFESRQIKTLQLPVLVPDLNRDGERQTAAERDHWNTLTDCDWYWVTRLTWRSWHCALVTLVVCSLLPKRDSGDCAVRAISHWVERKKNGLSKTRKMTWEDISEPSHTIYSLSCVAAGH